MKIALVQDECACSVQQRSRILCNSPRKSWKSRSLFLTCVRIYFTIASCTIGTSFIRTSRKYARQISDLSPKSNLRTLLRLPETRLFVFASGFNVVTSAKPNYCTLLEFACHIRTVMFIIIARYDFPQLASYEPRPWIGNR